MIFSFPEGSLGAVGVSVIPLLVALAVGAVAGLLDFSGPFFVFF